MMPPKKKPLDVLQRVIPKNPKYEGIRPVVDSGSTVSKVEQISTKEFLKRRDEQYGRVKASQLYGLLIEYSDGGGMDSIAEEDGEGSLPPRRPIGPTGEPCEFVRTAEDKPYLLIDVREPEEFAACHIAESVNIPARMLSRDTIPPEIYRYRNKPDAMIILYDSEERISTAVAVKMFERGCDNVFVVTGGLKSVGNKFEELIDGTLPAELKEKAPKGGRTVASSGRSVTSAVPSSARSVTSRVSSGSAWK